METPFLVGSRFIAAARTWKLSLGWRMPSLNMHPSSARLIKFAPPFDDFQRRLNLLTILNTRHCALSRRFIRLVASVLILTPLKMDSNGLEVRRCIQRSLGYRYNVANASQSLSMVSAAS